MTGTLLQLDKPAILTLLEALDDASKLQTYLHILPTPQPGDPNPKGNISTTTASVSAPTTGDTLPPGLAPPGLPVTHSNTPIIPPTPWGTTPPPSCPAPPPPRQTQAASSGMGPDNPPQAIAPQNPPITVGPKQPTQSSRTIKTNHLQGLPRTQEELWELYFETGALDNYDVLWAPTTAGTSAPQLPAWRAIISSEKLLAAATCVGFKPSQSDPFNRLGLRPHEGDMISDRDLDARERQLNRLLDRSTGSDWTQTESSLAKTWITSLLDTISTCRNLLPDITTHRRNRDSEGLPSWLTLGARGFHALWNMGLDPHTIFATQASYHKELCPRKACTRSQSRNVDGSTFELDNKTFHSTLVALLLWSCGPPMTAKP